MPSSRLMYFGKRYILVSRQHKHNFNLVVSECRSPELSLYHLFVTDPITSPIITPKLLIYPLLLRFVCSVFYVIKIILEVKILIDMVEFRLKEMFFFCHLAILTVSKYCRFHDEIFPWQPQMRDQQLYDIGFIQHFFVTSLTLSQWSSSGNPLAIQCAWNLDPSVHWNATGEMPVCFQWSPSGFPVAFQWSSSVFQLCK